MKVRIRTIKTVERTPKWQVLCRDISGRKRIEEKRWKKVVCKSCYKEIVEDKAVIAHIEWQGNIFVHKKCADKSVEIRDLPRKKAP